MPRPTAIARIAQWVRSCFVRDNLRLRRANTVLRRRLSQMHRQLEAARRELQQRDATIADLRESVRAKDSAIELAQEELELAAQRWTREIERQKAETAIYVSRRIASQRGAEDEE